MICKGNNTLQLVVHNTSSVNYQQAIIRLDEVPPGITVQPSKLTVSPLPANSSEAIPITLYANRPGKYEINVHANAFPAPKEGFLHTTLQFDVVPKPDTSPSQAGVSIFDEIKVAPTNIADDRLPISAGVSAQQGDVYSSYETGLSQLLNRIGQQHPRYSDALVYQHRLKENIAQSRRHGDTETRRAERSEIIERLNELAVSVLGTTFDELCIGTEAQQISEYTHKSLTDEIGQTLLPKRIFDTAAIRELLTIALDASDLNDLCQDYFPVVYKDFSEGMTTRKRKRLLIGYCEHHNQFEQLVRQIRKINPEQYEAFFPYLVKPVMNKFKSKKDADHIQAAKTLGRLGEPGAIPLLEAQLLKQPNPTVGYWLAVAIGEIGGDDAKDALDRIRQQLISQDVDPYTLLGIEDAKKLAEAKINRV